MKRFKRFQAVICCLAAVTLAGCQKEASIFQDPGEDYSCESGAYQISLPGQWEVLDNGGMTDSLYASRDEFEANVVRYSKLNMEVSGNCTDLNGFKDYYGENMLHTKDMEQLSDDYSVPGMNGCYMLKCSTFVSGEKKSNFVTVMDSDSAYYAVVITSPEKSFEDNMGFFKNFSATLRELAPAEEDRLADTLSWFNASYAIQITLNGGNFNSVAGYTTNESIADWVKSILEQEWQVTDRASADEKVNQMVNEGNNKDLLGYYESNHMKRYATREEFIAAMSGSSNLKEEDKNRLMAVFDAYRAYGDRAVLGWDLSRAMNLYGYYYLAGYYTYEEAMDASLAAAQRLQGTFGSWDEMMDSYFRGCTFWSGQNPEETSSQTFARKLIYDKLKELENSPYQIDWNTELKKEW